MPASSSRAVRSFLTHHETGFGKDLRWWWCSFAAPVTLPAFLSVGSASQFQVNSSGVVANYDNISTQGLGLSPILASPARLTGKTASIGSTTLCGSTTCAAGLYSVEYYLNCSTAGTGGTVVVAITWNDGANQSFSSASVPLASTGYAQGQVALYSAGAAAISYSTNVTGAAGSPQYALSLSVPRLQ
jgi:hypothetical protein